MLNADHPGLLQFKPCSAAPVANQGYFHSAGKATSKGVEVGRPAAEGRNGARERL